MAQISGFEVTTEGEVMGLRLDAYGQARLTSREGRGGQEFWLFCPRDWTGLIEWRRLMADCDAVYKEDLHSSYAQVIPPARYVIQTDRAFQIKAALIWAERGEPRQRNRDLMAIIEGEHGHFGVAIDEEHGTYLVSCPYGRQAPLKKIGATFDCERKVWVVPAELEAELGAALERAARGVRKARASVEKAVPTVEGIEVREVEAGFEVAFTYEESLVAGMRKIKTSRWDRDRKVWTVGAAGRKGLIAWLEGCTTALERVAAEKAEAQARREAEKKARAEQWAREKEERQRLAEEERSARAAERAAKARQEAEVDAAAGILRRSFPSSSRFDYADGSIVMVDGWPHRVLSRKPFKIEDEGMYSSDWYGHEWGVDLRLERLGEDDAQQYLSKINADKAKRRAERELDELARVVRDNGEPVRHDMIDESVASLLRQCRGWGPLAHRAFAQLGEIKGELWLYLADADDPGVSLWRTADERLICRHAEARAILADGPSPETQAVERWVYSDPNEPGSF